MMIKIGDTFIDKNGNIYEFIGTNFINVSKDPYRIHNGQVLQTEEGDFWEFNGKEFVRTQ